MPRGPDGPIGPDGGVDTPDTGSIVAVDASLPPSCKPPFAFADPVIEAAVRASAKVPSGPLSGVDILSVTDLGATGATSLSGVECLVNLQTFGVVRGSVSDLSALRGLTQLWQVGVTSNQVTDLSPLTNHPRPHKIYAADNRVASIDGLSLLPAGCSVLDLAGNPISGSQLTVPCMQQWAVIWGGSGTAGSGRCNTLCPDK